MNAILPPVERKRLSKLLGLLASDYDGEVLSAAKHASKLVQSVGMSWDEIIGESQASSIREAPQPTGWRQTVVECLRQADRLSDWEFSFLSSLSGSSFPRPTQKQQACLDRTAKRVLGGQP
jgi:hypothetical protein